MNPPAAAGSSAERPTLEEVARRAGVSQATASRAINGRDKVSPAAQEAVDAAVRALRYSPNRAARSLVRQRSDSIALVVPKPNERIFYDPFFAATLDGVSRGLTERDQQLVLIIAQPGEDRSRILKYLRDGNVDGALVVSHHLGDTLAKNLADLPMPSVFLGRPWSEHELVTYIDSDNIAGGRQAVRVLLERGCRKIGTIAGPKDVTASHDRLLGWRQAMAEAGLPDDAVTYGDFTEPGGEAAAEALLRRHPDIDGLVAASDLMAVGALRTLALRGRRVPDDVAVIGYDDFPVATTAQPALTTIKNPVEDMAIAGANLLLDRVGSRPGPPLRMLYPPILVWRASA